MREPPKMCPVCHGGTFRFRPTSSDVADIDCGYCGEFRITGSALPQFDSFNVTDRKKIYQWLYDQQQFGEKPEIDTHNLSFILSRKLRSFSEITNQFLLQLDKETKDFGQWIPREASILTQASGTFDYGYYDRFLEYLKEIGLIKIHNGNQNIALSPTGLERVEKMKLGMIESHQGFVAMWFSDEMQPIWIDGFEPAITEAGYIPRRIDMKEHVNKICDEIVSEIRRSRFLVADFTGQRGGVYYEAGFAHGLGIPVIFSCQDDEIKNLHFDIRQYNFINWKSVPDLKDRLRARIGATVGTGPALRKSP